MHRLMLIALALPLVATAQEPTSAGALGQLGMGPTSIERWLTVDVDSLRFPVGDDEGPSFKEGDRVNVIFEDIDNERVRVELDGRFGWVANTTLSPLDPNAEPLDFDLDALLESLGSQDQ